LEVTAAPVQDPESSFALSRGPASYGRYKEPPGDAVDQHVALDEDEYPERGMPLQISANVSILNTML